MYVNTNVCVCVCMCMKVKMEVSVSSRVQPFLTPQTVAHPPGSSVHGIIPGKNIGVDYHSFLQEIFPTQGLNLSLPWATREDLK